jgi:hypothetical protein
VHRDAGRIAGGGPAPRRVELPPRYEELDWTTMDTQADPDIVARITTPPPVSASPISSPVRAIPQPQTPLMPPPRSRTADSHNPYVNPHPLPVPPVPQGGTQGTGTHSRQTTM